MRKHRAILKGKVWEEYWEMETPRSVYGGGYYSSHPIGSISRGRDFKRLELHSMRDISCVHKHRMKSYEEFWAGDIDMPFLEVGERLFIADMGTEVIVEDRVRTTEENTCIYLVDYNVRIDASNNPKEAESYVVRKYNEKREGLIKDIAELDKKIEKLQEEEQEREESVEETGLMSWLRRLIERD